MKKLLLVVCLQCFLLSSCAPVQIAWMVITGVARVASSDTKTKSVDPCQGKSTQWDPGSKKYFCYDDNGDRVYK